MKIVWIVFGVFVTCLGKQIEVPCPEFCFCDILANLKRAVCSGRKLVSLDLQLPKYAQVLDLSYNRISDIDDNIFQNLELTNLKLLNLSHNAIRHIHFNGFMGLDGLKSLDLSYNVMNYLTKSWYDSLKSLEELYLRGNQLRSINELPQISINTLKILDIGNCGITSLKPTTFELIKNLEILDISNNNLQKLASELLKVLPKLKSLTATGNYWECKDQNLIRFKNLAKTLHVQYTDSCSGNTQPILFSVNKADQKFERIVMADEADTEKIQTNSWLVEDSVQTISNSTSCSNITIIEDRSILMEVIMLSPWMVISVVFVYGVLFGMVITCAMNLCIYKNRKKETPVVRRPARSRPSSAQRKSRGSVYKFIQKSRLNLHDPSEEYSDNETLIMDNFHLTDSTPVVSRRSES